MTIEEEMRVAQEQVDRLIDDGAPIVKLSVFDVLDSYTPSDKVKGEIEYTKELYLELVDKLKGLSEEDQSTFLKTLRDSDIIDNQSIEKEDSFMIALTRNVESDFSIELLLSKISNGESITKEDFIKMHDALFSGTGSDDKSGLRDNDLKFVGFISSDPQTKYQFENRAICYFPLRHTEIDEAVERYLGFVNNGIHANDEYDVAVLPIICHGLLASLQLFKDGNTRYGRLFQSVLLYQLANDSLLLDLPLPIVYASKQFAAYRNEYRSKIEKIVLNNDSEAWDDWIMFSLRRIQDGLFFNMSCIDRLTRNPRNTR